MDLDRSLADEEFLADLHIAQSRVNFPGAYVRVFYGELNQPFIAGVQNEREAAFYNLLGRKNSAVGRSGDG